MTTPDTFYTIRQAAEGVFRNKGSSFHSFIYPILDEIEVKPLIEILHRLHPKARHICYAYRYGPDHEYSRHHDDGEPSGTAGRPILSQLKSYKLQNTLLAVVRYFGGTLLGTGGLTHAYKMSAADAIQNATIILKHRYAYFLLGYNYPMDKKIKAWLPALNGQIVNQDFSDAVQSKISIPVSQADKFNEQLKKSALELHWPDSVSCQWIASDPY